MNYLLTFLIGIIFGLTISIFVTTYFSKKGGLVAIHEDVSKIAERIKDEIMP